jgi:hypothetical protein
MKDFVNWFKNHFSPLQQLLILGFIVRLCSVIFSKGFGWHDDHFLIIEPAQNWADGFDNNWIPSDAHPDTQPQGHSFFYIGIHFYFFKICSLLHINDPQTKMFLVRLFHALWSLVMIKYAYKIAEQYADKKAAWYTGIFITFFWFTPFTSVRNLVEFVCVPPFLMAIYILKKDLFNPKNFIAAGLYLGLAFSIRFQTLFIAAGVGLALLIYRCSFKNIFLLMISFFAIVFLTQGLIDYLIWKRPFAEFSSYVEYNVNNASSYGTDNWHMYFDLIFGMLIPPLSLVLFAGYFITWKKMPLLFWPALLYLAFHTYFPNKQERFIMTVLPLIIISGTVGAFQLYEKYKQKINPGLLRFSRTFVIVINTLLLCVLTFSYSKRHRVEAMTYLYKKNDSNNFFIEDGLKDMQFDFMIPPLFYYGKWPSIYGITKESPPDSALAYYNRLPSSMKQTYVVFWSATNIQQRVDSLKKRFPQLEFETEIEPSFIDKTLYWLNPYNDNQTAYIYRLPKNKN